MAKRNVTPINRKAGRPSRSPEEEMALKVSIVEAARTLFVNSGVDAVSMRKIAASAGINPMTIYKVFESKRTLLYYIWDDIFEELDHLISKTRKRKQSRQKELVGVIRCIFDFWLENPDCYRVIYLHQDIPTEGSETYWVDKNKAGRIGALADILEKGVADNSFKPHNCAEQAELIYTQILGLALAHITIPEYPWQEPTEMLNQTADMILGQLKNKS